tara:strand:- start:978 stop:2030 length:1053 start_codon:yes stop_codon:yes gene_type:complete
MFADGKLWVWIHVFLAFVHLIMGALVLGLMDDFIEDSNKTIYITYPNVTSSASPRKYSAALNQRTENEWTEFKLSPILIHAVVSVITGFSHAVSAWAYYDNGGVCLHEPNYVRWAEYSITASMMSISGLVSLGFTDGIMLSGVFMVGIGVQLCGFFIEATKGYKISLKYYETGQRLIWPLFFLLGGLMQLSISVPITVWTATANQKFGIWWAWGIYFVYYMLFPINALFDAICVPKDYTIKENAPAKGQLSLTAFSYTDKRYIVLSFCSKVSLYWITVASLAYNMTTGSERDMWKSVVYISCALPAGLTVAWLGWSFAKSWAIYREYRKSSQNAPPASSKGEAAISKLMF